MSKQIIQPVKGTRDFYPEDQAFQVWFYQIIKDVSESFGFQEYEGPTLETLDLYAAKSGEELVKKQAFTLKDQSGKTLALRPEMTPTLARMIAQKAGSLNFPVKWFTYGRRFRYENPQKGRGREFFQWDCDILGTSSPQSDAEVITIAATVLQKIGLTSNEVKIKINDREFLQNKLENIGINNDQIQKYFKIIDKKEKVNENDFREMLLEAGLEIKQIPLLLEILNNKQAYLESPWLTEIFKLVEKSGLKEYLEFDPTIVRGLDYYTRTVFEGWDINGEFRSVWGGGRYDNLTSEVGSQQIIPGVGFAMGDMVIKELLLANGKYPVLETNKTNVLVTVFSPDLFDKSLEISNLLRQNGVNTEVYLIPETKLDKQLKYADNKNIPYVIILGPDEIKNNTGTLKNLNTRTQETLSYDQLVKKLQIL